MTGSKHFQLYLSVLACLVLVVSFPAFWLPFYPHGDAVNHVARYWLLANLGDGQFIDQIYAADLGFRTNSLLEWLSFLLGPLLDPIHMNSLSIVASSILIGFSSALIQYSVSGRWHFINLLSLLFCFNYVMTWGFLNFNLAVSLASLGFAVWVYGRSSPSSGARNLYLFGSVAAAIPVLYVSHLAALLLYVALIALYEAYAWRVLRYALAGLIAGAAGFVLLMSLFVFKEGWLLDAGLLGLPAAEETLSALSIGFGHWKEHVTAVVVPFLTYREWWDALFLVGFLALFGALFLSGRISLDKRLVYVAGCLFLLALAAPVQIFGIWGPHIRVANLAMVVLIAASRTTDRRRLDGAAVLLAVVLLIAGRSAAFAHYNAGVARDLDELRATSDAIAVGSSVLVAVGPADCPGATIKRRLYQHFGSVLVIERQAFVPSLFTQPGVHSLTVTADYLAKDTNDAVLPTQALQDRLNKPPTPEGQRLAGDYANGWPASFDYLLVLELCRGFEAGDLPIEEVARGSYFQIYRTL